MPISLPNFRHTTVSGRTPFHLQYLSRGPQEFELAMPNGYAGYKYEVVSGYFAQDAIDMTSESADVSNPAVLPRLGLLDKSPDRWTALIKKILQLNQDDIASGIKYKLFLLVRSGQGYHNVAEGKYGPMAWDEYWARLNGNGSIIWGPDAELTDQGKKQAQGLQRALREEMKAGLPVPHRHYCSPLRRAIHTCEIMFEGVVYNKLSHPVFIMENCRDQHGVYTSSKRRSGEMIARSLKPHFVVEDKLSGDDVLWHPTIRETEPEVAERALKLLDIVFQRHEPSHMTSSQIDDNICISITTHAALINGFLAILDKAPIMLPTGGIIPLLVKATPDSVAW
ncbi:hypothetical protein D9619_004678 [Psilocybe cf. subviscida]|uniref:Uncharacterized protein n=1 Tax=Psilocybe cf. subviscida TaxID=2480587 RepID=A0A8H5F8R7_9AGAR|nr:hypothetical protein D9619_004678 [Psilocybe cf. subviscida]